MKLYRFSPIANAEDAQQAFAHIHHESHRLCHAAFGKYFPVAGNIAIFCHYDDEYEYLAEYRKSITADIGRFNQKYFPLHEPLTFQKENGNQDAKYTHLYIRKPDPYRHHVGDLDFYTSQEEYDDLKKRLAQGEIIPGARIFPSPRLDMIELYSPDSDVLAYLTTETMADVVKNTYSEA